LINSASNTMQRKHSNTLAPELVVDRICELRRNVFMKRLFTIALLACLAAFPVTAAVLFSNGEPDPAAGGVASNFGHDPEYEYQSADDFVLAAPATITQVRWWGLYQGSNLPLEPDAFTLRIFADVGGLPSAEPLFEELLPRVRRQATKWISGGYDVYEYTALLHPHVPLPAGTYWLSLVEDVDVEVLGVAWLWALSSNAAGNHAYRFVDDTAWAAIHPFSLAFEIRGVSAGNP
jgi:hypothetical protein